MNKHKYIIAVHRKQLLKRTDAIKKVIPGLEMKHVWLPYWSWPESEDVWTEWDGAQCADWAFWPTAPTTTALGYLYNCAALGTHSWVLHPPPAFRNKHKCSIFSSYVLLESTGMVEVNLIKKKKKNKKKGEKHTEFCQNLLDICHSLIQNVAIESVGGFFSTKKGVINNFWSREIKILKSLPPW